MSSGVASPYSWLWSTAATPARSVRGQMEGQRGTEGETEGVQRMGQRRWLPAVR
jgi:hypothetical protein